MSVGSAFDTTLFAPPGETDAEALLREADVARAAGDRARAIELYERVMHELDPRQGAQAATVLRRLGLVCWEDGQLDYAIDVLQVALVAASRSGDVECAAHAQNILAVCHWQRGQLDEAERLYHAAWATAMGARNRSLVAMIDQNLGIIESASCPRCSSCIPIAKRLQRPRSLDGRDARHILTSGDLRPRLLL